jgi:[ribosomal protein S5]-alanine N-acetyltransferase
VPATSIFWVVIEPIRTERLQLISCSAETIEALLAGTSGLAVPEGWPDEHVAGYLRMRADQMRASPPWEEWLVRAVVLDAPDEPMVGYAGFHGPPGINGPGAVDAVELGYTIFEPHRGRGYATEAAQALMDWAREEHGIHRFIASVAPGNAPSLAIVRKLGFVQRGEQWDEEDGLELVFERRVDPRNDSRPQRA